MAKPDQFVRMAEKARQKARAIKDPVVKRQLLMIAREWEALAEAHATETKLNSAKKNGRH